LVDEYPAGIVYEWAPPQRVSVVTGPAVAVGRRSMVSANVADAWVHWPLSDTVIVRVIRPPRVLSLVPKVYVGLVVVLPEVNVPSPLLIHEMVP